MRTPWRASAQSNIGIVFQSFHLIPTMTAIENVAVPLEFAGVRDARQRASRELAAVGLARTRCITIRRSFQAASSSGSPLHARSRLSPPFFWPMSLPAISMRRRASEIIDLVFGNHTRRGTTLMLVTHDAALASRCDRLVRLRSGARRKRTRSATRLMSASPCSSAGCSSPRAWRRAKCAGACAAFTCSSRASLLGVMPPLRA